MHTDSTYFSTGRPKLRIDVRLSRAPRRYGRRNADQISGTSAAVGFAPLKLLRTVYCLQTNIVHGKHVFSASTGICVSCITPKKHRSRLLPHCSSPTSQLESQRTRPVRNSFNYLSHRRRVVAAKTSGQHGSSNDRKEEGTRHSSDDVSVLWALIGGSRAQCAPS